MRGGIAGVQRHGLPVLRGRARDIADFIKQNMKKFTPAAKFYSYIILYEKFLHIL